MADGRCAEAGMVWCDVGDELVGRWVVEDRYCEMEWVCMGHEMKIWGGKELVGKRGYSDPGR